MGEGKWVNISLEPGSHCLGWILKRLYSLLVGFKTDKFSILKTDLEENAPKIEEIWRRWLCLQAWRERISQTGIFEFAKVNSLFVYLCWNIYISWWRRNIFLWKTDSMSLSVCSVIDLRWHQNMVRTRFDNWDIIV